MKKLIISCLLITLATAAFAQNKSVSILGDSYSTFEGYLEPDTNYIWYFRKAHLNQTDVTDVTQTWWHQFIANNGYKLCKNNSLSGSTICNTGYNKQDVRNLSFIRRMDNLGNPDIILIFGGTNDSWAHSPEGEYKYSDWTSADLYYVRPATAYMLDFITKRYPNVEVYFILNSELDTAFNETAETVCKHYNVPLLKLHDIGKQAGHPNIAGMKAIAEQLTSFVKKEQKKKK